MKNNKIYIALQIQIKPRHIFISDPNKEQDFQRHMPWFLQCLRNGGDKWLFVFCDTGEIGYHHYFFST